MVVHRSGEAETADWLSCEVRKKEDPKVTNNTTKTLKALAVAALATLALLGTTSEAGPSACRPERRQTFVSRLQNRTAQRALGRRHWPLTKHSLREPKQ